MNYELCRPEPLSMARLTVLLRGAILICHNYVRPHITLKNGTPAEVAGIEVRGEDKWLTLIRNAKGTRSSLPYHKRRPCSHTFRTRRGRLVSWTRFSHRLAVVESQRLPCSLAENFPLCKEGSYREAQPQAHLPLP